MQQNIRDYKRHEMLAQRQEEKLVALQEIGKLYREMNQAIDRWRVQTFLVQWSHKEIVQAQIDRFEVEKNDCIAALALTEESIEEISSQITQKENRRRELDVACAQSSVFQEEEKLRNRKQVLLEEQKKLLQDLQSLALKIKKEALRLNSLSLEEDSESAIAEYEISIASEDKMAKYLDEMSLQYAHEQDAELRGVYSDSQFIWPVPSCTLLTSPYGYRIHPILDYERLHAGLDIGAKFGEEIIAADGGTVLIAEYSDSYGNFVLIDHGDRYSTAYGHMSEIAVEAGQEVKQGEFIGYIGSTGWSTGPHLHFEIRLDGERIDPEEFFSGLIHYNC